MKQKGSITVFFSLILILICSIITAALESARYSAASYLLASATLSSWQSVFAEYDRQLWENYHLLFLPCEEEIEQRMQEYLSYYLEPSKGLLTWQGNMWDASLKEIKVGNIKFASDQGGKEFLDQIYDYMRYGITDSLIGEIKEMIGHAEKADEKRRSSDVQVEEFFSKWNNRPEERIIENENTIPDNPLSQAVPLQESNLSQPESLLDQWIRWKNQKVLSLAGVNQEALSRQKVSIAHECLPSSQLESQPKPDISLKEKIYLEEYIMSHFTSYLSKQQDEGIQYEIEYILFGCLADKENLEKAVERILLIREGMNLVYLLGDQTKRQEVEAAATVIAVLCSQPEISKVVEAILLAIWAFAEAVSDVKSLLQGKKIKLIKDKTTWKSSFGSLLWEKGFPGSEKGDSKGMDYEDYLRLLLLLQGDGEQYPRAMDVIDWNMKKENKEFSLIRCIGWGEVNVIYHMKRKWAQVPVISQLLQEESSGYEMQMYASSGY